MGEYKSPYINVDGNQVFSADYTFQQMMAQNCRIDSVKTIAVVAMLLGIGDLIINIIQILL